MKPVESEVQCLFHYGVFFPLLPYHLYFIKDILSRNRFMESGMCLISFLFFTQTMAEENTQFCSNW